jgi:hypothetical protein
MDIHWGADKYPYSQGFWVGCDLVLDYSEANEKYLSEEINQVTCKKCIEAHEESCEHFVPESVEDIELTCRW